VVGREQVDYVTKLTFYFILFFLACFVEVLGLLDLVRAKLIEVGREVIQSN